MSTLFSQVNLANVTLKNRVVMPPMTRSRSTQPGDIANKMMAEYYAQRAGAGLIISEGTQISELGKGYAWTPGIYTQAQVAGWKEVTDAVHLAGGVIFAQLWHVGRVAHSKNTGGQQPISSSAIQASGVNVFIDDGQQPRFVESEMPRAMSLSDIQTVVSEYQHAAKSARIAGFDGIELHAANGYLINQFIDSQTNNRTDLYGGDLNNRLRFLREVVKAVSQEFDSNCIGVRLAPLTTLNGAVDDKPEETYTAVVRMLDELNVAYVHIAEADWEDAPVMSVSFKQALREAFSGLIIYAGKYTKERAEQAIKAGWADMIGFGRPFVANPDLPQRMAHDYPLTPHDPETLFGGDQKGYTDYPTFKQT